MGMVSMFGVCVPPGTLKPCPPRHVFDARRVSTTSLPAEHRNYAHLGMFSMLSTCSLHLYQPNIKAMLRCTCLDVRRVSTTTPPAEPRNYAHLDMFLMFGMSTSSQLQNHAWMGMMVFGVPPPPPHLRLYLVLYGRVNNKIY